eukprot:TRINITY_DN50029_c0_g1_i1.p1 TRINITY_DN50029_c0_g1~~TRINITY_DN50029_c0_g1_i1.p1  ORF type:complete len:344 (+),score=80.71 TRINITY_DN50029_c0_g1_i1:73-1032(+)
MAGPLLRHGLGPPPPDDSVLSDEVATVHGGSEPDEGLGPVSQTCGRYLGVRLDSEQEVSAFALTLHLLHPLMCTLNYIAWVSVAEDDLGAGVVAWYRVLLCIAVLSFVFVSSPFYMWSFRFHAVSKMATRRRVFGLLFNLFLSDAPLFGLEVHIVWQVTWTVNALFCVTFIVTVLSFAFSGLRVWLHVVHRYVRAEEAGEQQAERALARATLPGFRRTGAVDNPGAASFDLLGTEPDDPWGDTHSRSYRGAPDEALAGAPGEPQPRGDLLADLDGPPEALGGPAVPLLPAPQALQWGQPRGGKAMSVAGDYFPRPQTLH